MKDDTVSLKEKKSRVSYQLLENKKKDKGVSVAQRIMIIGAGLVSGKYLEYFSKDKRTELVTVADPDKAVQSRVIKKYNPEVVVSDYKEVLDRNEIDIVVVAVPHNLHYPIVMDALHAGKHVICEKPLAISVKEADGMIDTAERVGKKLLVTLNMRFDACAVKINEVIKQNRIGKIFMASSAYLGYEVERLNDLNDWKGDLQKAGGGVLLDGGYHIIDFINSCLGQAVSVQAMGGRYSIEAPNKGEDNVSLLLEYQDSCIANLQVSFTACSPGCGETPTLRLRHELMGDKGTLSARTGWDPIRGSCQKLELFTPAGIEDIDLDKVDPPEMIGHLLDCILDGSKPMVTAIDARNASAVVEAAYESMKTGHKTDINWRTELIN